MMDMPNSFDVHGRLLEDDELAAWLAEHSLGNRFGLAVQSTDPAHQLRAPKAPALAIVAADGEGRYIDTATLTEDDEAALASWLGDPGPPKAVHDAKLVARALARCGWALRGVTSDTASAAYLLDPEQPNSSLNELLVRHMRCALPADDTEDMEDPEQAVHALILQACAVLDLADVLDEELARIGSSSVFSRLELPVLPALSEMELAGIAVDRVRLTHILTRVEDEVDAARLQVAVDVLLNSTASDGRIHPTFHRTEAATGRISSRNPGLHDLPLRRDDGANLRDVFVAGDGFVELMTARYGEIEARVIAHLSDDAGLIGALNSGENPYRALASHAFPLSVDKVTSQFRRRLELMFYESTATIGAEDHDFWRDLSDNLRGVVDDARRIGYCSTLLGRRRYLPDLDSANRQVRETAERAALSVLIGGSAADITKVAMINVHRAIKDAGLKSRMLLQVDNELVLEVAEGERETLAAHLGEQLRGAYPLQAPLEVLIGYGNNWGIATRG
jgi:DNA polymerase I-like protein with 3'-5' exonuclease and polymerase domains